MTQNRFVTLTQPVQEGQLLASHFSLRDRDIPSIGDGQLLVQRRRQRRSMAGQIAKILGARVIGLLSARHV
jgi:NADPH-dependent curcumin reductase CurA